MTLLKTLGIPYPIFQAPMAGVATAELAAAVSNSGGLGALGIAAMDAHTAQQTIRATQALTNRPFNVNVFCHQPPHRKRVAETQWLDFLSPLFHSMGHTTPKQLKDLYPSFHGNEPLLHVLLTTRPKVVSFHFGLPSARQLALLHAAGIYTFATATNLQEAQKIEQAGVKAIVAQGYEAGGHRGLFHPQQVDEQLDTLSLIQTLRPHIKRPLIAAGGLMTGVDIQKALALGADAAQLGTAFVACPESAASTPYRQRMKASQPTTRMTSTISGRPARGIVNDYIRYCEQPSAPEPAAYPLAYDATKQLQAAAHSAQADFDCGAYWAGKNVQFARHLPAKQLMRLLIRELAS